MLLIYTWNELMFYDIMCSPKITMLEKDNEIKTERVCIDDED